MAPKSRVWRPIICGHLEPFMDTFSVWAESAESIRAAKRHRHGLTVAGNAESALLKRPTDAEKLALREKRTSPILRSLSQAAG